MDSTTNFSPKKQDSAASTNKPSRLFLSQAKTNSGSRVLEKLSSPKKEPQKVMQTDQELFLSYPRVHAKDENYKEAPASIHNGRERLKRHREEVAGEVRIPDKWSEEKLLQDWMDYSSFDKLLAPKGLALAREALIAEGRRAGGSSQRLRTGISRCFC